MARVPATPRFARALDDLGEILPAYRRRLPGLARPAWQLRATPTSRVKLGASHLGGQAHVPADFEWPRSTDDFPLTFIAQLRCADLPLRGMPRRGWLLFFATVIGEHFEDENPSFSAIEHVVARDTELEPRSAPTTMSGGQPIPVSERDEPLSLSRLAARPVATLPYSEDVRWEADGIKFTRAQSERWDRVVDGAAPRPGAETLHYGGHHAPLQGDPRFMIAAEEFRRLSSDRAICKAATTLVSVLHIDLEFQSLYYVVRQDHLRAGRFDRAWMAVQRD